MAAAVLRLDDRRLYAAGVLQVLCANGRAGVKVGSLRLGCKSESKSCHGSTANFLAYARRVYIIHDWKSRWAMGYVAVRAVFTSFCVASVSLDLWDISCNPSILVVSRAFVVTKCNTRVIPP